MYWPDSIAASTSNVLVSKIDIYALLTALLGQNLADNKAIDSRDQLGSWFGRNNRERDYLLEESVGSLAIRNGDWKYSMLYTGGGGLEWVAEDKTSKVASPLSHNFMTSIAIRVSRRTSPVGTLS